MLRRDVLKAIPLLFVATKTTVSTPQKDMFLHRLDFDPKTKKGVRKCYIYPANTSDKIGQYKNSYPSHWSSYTCECPDYKKGKKDIEEFIKDYNLIVTN